MERTAVIAGLILTVVLGGTTPRVAESQQVSDRPAPQPSLDLPADFARVLRDYERHWQAGDEDGLANLFVEEGLIVRRGTWIRGRDTIRNAYQDSSGPLRLRAIEYAGDGDVGYIVGAYGYGEGRPVDDSGLFVLTLRRGADGRWLIVSDLDRGSP